MRQLAKVNPYLPAKVFERLIQLSLLADCNSPYFGLDQASPYHLQLVLNAAAHLLTGTKWKEDITPVMASLQWLPVSI